MINELKSVLTADFTAQQQALSKQRAEILAAETAFTNPARQAQPALAVTGIEQKIAATADALRDLSAVSAQTVGDLGLTPAQAADILVQHGVTPVWRTEDNVVVEHARRYQSKNDFIAVHQTHILPVDNQIKSDEAAGCTYHNEVKLDGKTYDLVYPSPRATVHFALNCAPGAVAEGLGQNQYTVLVPFTAISNGELARVGAVNTFTRGSVDLPPDAWILCPENEVVRAQQQNPNVHVLGYHGKNHQEATRPLLSQLGYRAEKGTACGWVDRESQQQFTAVIQREGLVPGNYTDTTFAEDEELKLNLNKAVALAKLLTEHGLVRGAADLARLTPQLEQQFLDFGFLLKGLTAESRVRDVAEPDAILANNRQVEAFADAMAAAGLAVDPAHQTLLQEWADAERNPAGGTGLADFYRAHPEINGVSFGEVMNAVVGSALVRAQEQTRQIVDAGRSL